MKFRLEPGPSQDCYRGLNIKSQFCDIDSIREEIDDAFSSALNVSDLVRRLFNQMYIQWRLLILFMKTHILD